MKNINMIVYEAMKANKDVDADIVEYIDDNFDCVYEEISDQDRWTTYYNKVFKLEYNDEVYYFLLCIGYGSTECQDMDYYSMTPYEVQYKEVTKYEWVRV